MEMSMTVCRPISSAACSVSASLTLARLRALLDTGGLAMADILNIEKEMTRLRGQIEAIKGEQRYLRDFAAAEDSFVVAAETEAGRIVGCATGSAITGHHGEFAAPLAAAGYDLASTFYFGESVLLPAYRGRGLGHAFFDAREAHARALGGLSHTAFAAVDRDDGDPRRPAGHRGNEAFWAKRGYVRQPGMTMHLHWNELDRGEVTHPLTFWLRPLEATT